MQVSARFPSNFWKRSSKRLSTPADRTSRRSWTLRGGRLTRWKGIVASCAPSVAELAGVAPARWLGVSLAAMLVANPGLAADKYWDANATGVGSGGSGSWNISTALWSPSDDGVSGPYSAWINSALDTAIFGGTAGTVTLGAPISANGLTFNSNGYTLTGGTLTLAGTTPTILANGSADIYSVLAGNAGFTKAGAGTLRLFGANTFAGDVRLDAGTLSVIDDAALGADGNAILTAAGATVGLVIGGTGTQRTVTIGDGGSLSLQGSGGGSALVTGNGRVAVGTGVTMSNDANTYTGSTTFRGVNGVAYTYFTSIGNLGEASSLGAPTTVADGTIVFNQSSQYSDNVVYLGDGDSSNRNWNLLGAAALVRNRGTGTLSITGDVYASGGGGFYAEGADIELLGTLSGVNYSFNGSAGRAVTMGDANTYTGQSNINVITVRASVLADAGIASSFGMGNAAIAIGADGVLSYTGTGDSSDRAWIIDAGSIRNDGSGALVLSGAVDLGGVAGDGLTLGGDFTGTNTFSGVMSGNGDLISNGAGTWVLSGANTRSGAILVDGGTLAAGNASAFGTVTGITVNDGTLDLGGFDLATPTLAGSGGSIDLGAGTLTVDTKTNTTYAGGMTGSGGLTKTGIGTLTLTGASTYTGDTSLIGGVLALDFSAAGAPADNILSDSSILTMAGGKLNVTGAGGDANSQTFGGLNITAGNNQIGAISGAGGSTTINFGAINRTGGLVNFVLPQTGDFTTTNSVLGGWATVNGSDYAKVVSGVITAFTPADYSNKDDAANWLTGDVVSDTGGAADTPFFGTVTGSQQLGGLKYTADASSTVSVATGQALGTDGTIIVAPSVGTSNQRITGGAVTGSAGGVLGVQQNGAGNFTIDSMIVDNGGALGFTKGGAGLVALTGASTFTGATTLSGGTLAINSVANAGMASAIGAAGADAANLVLESGTLRYAGATASTDRGFTLVNGGPSRTIEVASAGTDVTFGGLVTSPDDAGFIKTGAGTLTLANGSNDYVGVTTVNRGTLAVSTLADGGEASSIGKSGSDAANLVLDGGSLNYLGATAGSDRGLTLGTGSGGVGVADANTTLTVSGTLVGAGGLRKDGDGTLVLSGINTYAGGTVVNAGILRAGSAQAFGVPTALMSVNSGGTLELGGFDIMVGGLLGDGVVDLGSHTLTSNGVSANGFSGKITGSGGFTRTGSWTQVLSGCQSDYTGKTTLAGRISVGCLEDGGVASDIGASSADAANLVFTNGTLAYTGVSTATDRGFTLQSGTGAIDVTNAATTLTFTGQVVGAGSLRKDGLGTLILSGDNTYTGSTRITGGVLEAASAHAISGGDLVVDNVAGATADLGGFDTSVRSLSGGGTAGGTVDLRTATLTLGAGSGGVIYGGVIQGSGNLVKDGNYTQRLSGCDSTFSGTTTINRGALEVACLNDGGVDSSIGSSSADASNLVINGGTLRYVGTGGSTDRQFTLGASGGNALDASGTGAIEFTSNAAITFAAADTAQTLTLAGTNTDNNTLAAQLGDNGAGVTALVKNGVGTWVLTNPGSTYTGPTTINGGVLAVDKLADGGQASSLGASSADASNLVVGNGSTLRYTGTGDTTNRLFTLSAGVTYLQSSGTGAIVFTDTGPVTLAGNNQTRTIALGGTNSDDNILAGSIGDAGTGKTILAKNDAGTWVLTGNNTFTGNTVINDGILKIGNGGATGSIASDVIVTGAGTLGFNRSDAYTFGGLISGSGIVNQFGSGVTTLTGDNTYTGVTVIDAGTLLVNGNQSAATGQTTVQSGATLGGAGILGGNVVVADGTLAPGSGGAGTLTINGDLMLSGGSFLSMQFGQAGTAGGALNDLIDVKGNLTLDGTLDVAETMGGSYDPGIYRIVSYAGTLTDNGLDIGTLPDGMGVIQTSIAGQVNLLAGGNEYSFWDGDAGPKFNSSVDGGNGTWQNGTGNNNWTEANGLLNAAYSDGTFAIFAGTAGVVSVDNGLGQVTAKGMQFATDGYTVNGAAIELVEPQATIRVGDGTVAGAGMTATIDSVLAGNAQVVKTDAGTLVLNGINTYTGGTAINGGTLRVGSNASLGDAAGGLSFNGGTLLTTAAMSIDRTVVLDGTGTFDNLGADLTLSGDVAGAGSLVKRGTGTLILTGDAGHTGGTTITTGTLQVGDGSTTGSIAGDIADNGVLTFDRADAFTYAGAISGSGALNQDGAGVLTLSGASTYGGFTYVNAGMLDLTGQIIGTSALVVASAAGSSAEMTVDGAGAALTTTNASDRSYIGDAGNGVLTVRNGGSAAFGVLGVARQAGSTGTLNIVGSGTAVTADDVVVGLDGTGTLNILAGGTLTSDNGRVGDMVSGIADTATVSGPGSRWDIGDLFSGRGDLVTLADGGVMTAARAIFGSNAGAGRAALLVTGSGSRFETAGSTLVANGLSEHGSITVADGGTLKAGSYINLGSGDAALNIGGAEGAAATHAGTVDVPVIDSFGDNDRINFNHVDAGYVFVSRIQGSGAVNHNGPGSTVLTGANTYLGETTVNAGALYVDGDQTAATGDTVVHGGATLGGGGIIGGNVAVDTGGMLDPGSSGTAPGTLSILRDLTLAAGSIQTFSFGQANVPGGPLNDLVNVGGDLALGGTLNVNTSTGGSFDPGVYRVFNYGGVLTDGGWTVNVPSPTFFVQTSIAHQVNLVNTAGLALNFWDGDGGPKNDGNIDGGNGAWQANGAGAGNDNWTDATGSVNASYADGTFAIFTGEAGNVTVDASLGAVNASGMQFMTDGYVVSGDAINMVGTPDTVIRVGDGTTAGAGATATINAELTGNSRLVKSDMGTLVLDGINTYTGGTAITGGTVQVAADDNLGATTGALSFDGGALHTTAGITSARDVVLDGTGALITDAATALTLTGAVTGGGALTKDGVGTLVLEGDNHYTGATAVDSGTLLVNGNQSAATGATSVATGAVLGGTGVLGGDVAIADGGTLAPGAAGVPATLGINGSLALSGGSTLQYQFGGAGVAGGALNDLVNVGGDLTLDGTLNVTVPSGGAFDPGIYRVFNYAGTLVNNGLMLGSVPAAGVLVQTSVAGQVNLVNSSGLALNFWDGALGPKNDAVVNGGDGTWQAHAGNDNWTDAAGSINAGYADGGFAIFAGNAGTVTVDNSIAPVEAAGMQFAVDGYQVEGDDVLLTGPQSVIRVGDGSAAGTDITATIDAVLSGGTQLVKTDAGTLVLNGVNAYAGGTAINGGSVQIAADEALGEAAGVLTLDGGTLHTTADIVSARDVVLDGAGTLLTDTATTLELSGAIAGGGALTKDGTGTLVLDADSSAYTGLAQVAAGTLTVNGTLGGGLTIDSGARVDGTGRVGSTTNRGTLAPGSAGMGTLTVQGDYAGDGGNLEIATALGDDHSATSRLVVEGATSGTTQVDVTNRGGLGAQTVEGIKVVDVAGTSNGSFILRGDYVFEGESAVVAGAYGYRLYKGGASTPDDGDWYLRSALLDPQDPVDPESPEPLYQPGVPIYESYAGVLQEFNQLGTLQQRVGNRSWPGSAGATAQAGADDASGAWVQVEGAHASATPAVSTSRASRRGTSWQLRAGVDGTAAESASGRYAVGVYVQSVKGSSSIRSPFGAGSIDADGNGLGATLTWYGANGFYVDGQTRIMRYSSDLDSATAARRLMGDSHGTGFGLGVEAGQRVTLRGGWSLTPQAQLAYSTVRFSAFEDVFGARVHLRHSRSFVSRLGTAVNRDLEWQDAQGNVGRAHVYGIANLYYDSARGALVDVAQTAFQNRNDRLYGGVGIGGTLDWGNGKYSVYGQALWNTSLKHASGNHSIGGTAGFRVRF